MKKGRFLHFIVKYHRHALMMAVALFAFCLCVFLAHGNFYTLWISLKSLVSNFVYVFARFFNSSLDVPKQPFDYLDLDWILAHYHLPFASDVRVVAKNYHSMFYIFINEDFFIYSGSAFLTYLIIALRFISLIGIFVVPMAAIGLWRYFLPREGDGAKCQHQTKPMRIFQGFDKRVVWPIKRWFRLLFRFNLRNRAYLVLIFVFVVFAIGGFSVAVDILAWYFLFIVSFDPLTVFKTLFTSVVNLFPFFNSIPLPIYAVVIYLVVDRIRCKIALKRLEKQEVANREIIESLGILSIVNGPPGVGKTLVITDMGMSCEAMFREKLLSVLTKYRNLFPHFNWAYFEKHLVLKVLHRRIYNRSHIESWILNLKVRWERGRTFLFDYDANLHPIEVYDELGLISLFDAMETYAKAYFLYSQDGALAAANYGIRFDHRMKKDSLFPSYDYNFFTFDYRKDKAYDLSSFTIPMDMDTHRLGMKFDNDNPNNYTFEGGVLLLQEINKERGNQRDYEGLKKSSGSVNQLNDDFNRWFELIRHMCTIDHYPFGKAFFDYQRMDALNVNLSALAEHRITLSKIDTEMRSTIRGFFYVRLFLEWLCFIRDKFMARFRKSREDQALLPHLIDGLITPIFMFLLRRHNMYDFKRVNFDISSGSSEVARSPSKDDESVAQEAAPRMSRIEIYYIMPKKIFSNRYATDSYHAWFKAKLAHNPKGYYEQLRFSSVYPSIDEYDRLHSYLVRDLNKMGFPSDIHSSDGQRNQADLLAPLRISPDEIEIEVK